MFSVSVATEVTMMRYEIQYERLAGVIAIYRTLVWVDLHGEIPGSLLQWGLHNIIPRVQPDLDGQGKTSTTCLTTCLSGR